MKLAFSVQIIGKKLKYRVQSKSIQWEAICFMRTTDGRTDGRTGMTKLIVAFRNFANAFKNY
jgi:hypothetical protein